MSGQPAGDYEWEYERGSSGEARLSSPDRLTVIDYTFDSAPVRKVVWGRGNIGVRGLSGRK